MGLFDTVLVSCPKCDRQHGFQSKSGECNMDVYTLEDCPDDVLLNVNRHSPYTCKCGCVFQVDLKTKEPIIK